MDVDKLQQQHNATVMNVYYFTSIAVVTFLGILFIRIKSVENTTQKFIIIIN